MSYKIIRFFFNGRKRTIVTGLTKQEAQDHCNDPETSSRTCTKSSNKARTRKYGPWFDGWTEE